MKKLIIGATLATSLLISSHPSYAASATPSIKVDNQTIVSDVQPETVNYRTMVPLRVISENLGATVIWSKSEVSIIKDSTKIVLHLNSTTAQKDSSNIILDAKPYLKNNRVFVPIRFIAEAFGCKVGYSKSTVSIETAPVVIDNIKIASVIRETRMIIGTTQQQISGNVNIKAIYDAITNNLGETVNAPAYYSELPSTDYLQSNHLIFNDSKGNKVHEWSIYGLTFTPTVEQKADFPSPLIHDNTTDHWYLFNKNAEKSIYNAIDKAFLNGSVQSKEL
jgi:hypothetical protein